jgi:HEAT repeat protein
LLICGAIHVGTVFSGEPENAESISDKLLSEDLSKRFDGLGDLTVAHEGLVGCLPALVKLAHLDGDRQEYLDWQVDAIRKIGEFGPRAQGYGAKLLDLLEHTDSRVRIAAADAILSVEGKSEPAISVLVAEAQGPEADGRQQAIHALGQHPRVAKNSLPVLLVATRDASPEIREAAAEALGEIAAPKSAEVIDTLSRLLADPEPSVQVQAASALWNLDVAAATILPTLIKLVKKFQPDTERDVTAELWGHAPGMKLIEKIGPDAESAVPALSAALESPQMGQRIAACDALAAIGPSAAPAIERLSKALRDTDVQTIPLAHRVWVVADRAAIALGKLGPASRPVLLAALSDKDKRVRNVACTELANLPPDDDTIAAMRRLLSDPNVPVRASAAFHLGKMGPKALVAVPQLVALLNERGDWLSFPGGGIGTRYSLGDHAREALQNLNPPLADVMPSLLATLRMDQRLEPAMQAYLAQLGPAAKEGAPVIEPWLKDEKQRAPVMLTLSSIAPDHPGLVELLLDYHERNNDLHFFMRSVGNLGPRARSALPRLHRDLREQGRFPDDRAMIASAILRIDPTDRAAIVFLAESLQDLDRERDDVLAAITLWSELGREREAALDKLLTGLTAVSTEPTDDAYFRDLFEKERRLRSALLLNELGTHRSEVIEALIKLCGCDHCGVRGDAADALGNMKEAAVGAAPTLVKLLDDDEHYGIGGDFYGNGSIWHYPGDHARDALTKIGPAALPALRAALQSESRTVRRRAAEAIGNLGAPAATAKDDLLSNLQDPHREVRAAAAQAIGSIGDARPAAIDALILALNDPHLPVRIAAAQSLASFGQASNAAIPALQKMLQDQLRSGRNAAQDALKRIHPTAP